MAFVTHTCLVLAREIQQFNPSHAYLQLCSSTGMLPCREIAASPPAIVDADCSIEIRC